MINLENEFATQIAKGNIFIHIYSILYIKIKIKQARAEKR